jgi:hypothetical protein
MLHVFKGEILANMTQVSDVAHGPLVFCRREVLINRGWVPRAWMEPETRKEGQITGNVRISGMLRNKENVCIDIYLFINVFLHSKI